MNSLSIETRVGAFVLMAVAVLSGFVLVLGDFSLGTGYRLFADFAYTGNLQPGAPVKVSGLRVGRVAGLHLLSSGSAPRAAATQNELGQSSTPVIRVDLALESVALPLLTETTRLAIGTQGLIGDAYVELSPGRGGAQLAEGSAVRGMDAPELHVLVLELARIVDALSLLAGSSAAAGAPGEASVTGVDQTSSSGAGDGGQVLSLVASLLREHKGELGQAISDAAVSARELRVVLGALHEATGAGQLHGLVDDMSSSAALARQQLPGLIGRFNAVLTTLDTLGSRAEHAVDPDALAAIVADARAAAQNLEALSREGRGIMNRVGRGEGTVGGLVTDPQIYDDLKELMRELKRNPWKVFWRD